MSIDEQSEASPVLAEAVDGFEVTDPTLKPTPEPELAPEIPAEGKGKVKGTVKVISCCLPFLFCWLITKEIAFPQFSNPINL